MPCPLPGDLPNRGIKPRSPAMQADSLLSEPPGKPKVKVVQSCPTLCNPIDYTAHGTVQARILEWVAFPFPTQGSNPGLPHCRWILYQLSHKRSPKGIISRIDAAAAAAKSLQSCPTLCDPVDGSPPGSPVPGILQARTLEWVAISFSNA